MDLDTIIAILPAITKDWDFVITLKALHLFFERFWIRDAPI